MKNKTFTYLLLAIVGVIYFKLFIKLKGNSESNAYISNNEIRRPENRLLQKPEIFNLNANFRDPFLGKKITMQSEINKKPESQSSNNIKKPKKVEVETVYWPTIIYYGFIQKNSTKIPRILISIDGSVYKLKSGESILDDIQIMKADRNTVKLKYKNLIKEFFVQKS